MMSPFQNHDLEAKRLQLQSAEAELKALKEQIRTFEAQVDNRLGALLDQLSVLRAQTSALDDQLRDIRERKLFGDDLIRYLDGAPRPTRSSRVVDLTHLDLGRNQPPTSVAGRVPVSLDEQIPDIRALYRKLARRYHPDLARNDADRVMCNEQMAKINRAFTEGDLMLLMRLAGMEIPLSLSMKKTPGDLGVFRASPKADQEELDSRLKAVRLEIDRLSRLPMVKLSLEVKLAQRNRRDLLTELAKELEYKVRRKIAERDYLQSQIYASFSGEDHPIQDD